MGSKKLFLISDWEQFRKQGRGCGRCDKYRPGFLIREVCSTAQRERVHIRRFGRTFEMMSHGETLTLLQLDWNDRVIEVREQFPLDPAITTKIAQDFNLYHPGYTRGGTIMTTDFLVTYRTPSGKDYLKAYQIKRSEDDYADGRTRAKLKIEAEYWKRSNIPWCVVLSASYNKILCDNLEHLHPYRETTYTVDDLIFLFRILSEEISANPHLCYEDAASGEIEPLPDRMVSLSVSDGLKVLLSRKMLSFPISEKPLAKCHLRDFKENCHVPS